MLAPVASERGLSLSHGDHTAAHNYTLIARFIGPTWGPPGPMNFAIWVAAIQGALWLPKGGHCPIFTTDNITKTMSMDAKPEIYWQEKGIMPHAMHVIMDIEGYTKSIMHHADCTFGICWAVRNP